MSAHKRPNVVAADGSGELLMLRAMRPFITCVSVLLWIYALVGMPLPHGVAIAFDDPLRQLLRVECLAMPGALGFVWLGGHFAPRAGPSNDRTDWAFAVSIVAMGILMILLLHSLNRI